MNKIPFRYDIEGICKEMEIELTDISALYSEYFNEMKSNLEDCRNLCNEKNWDRLERVVHNIKGISVSLGITDIFLVSNKFDSELKNKIYENASRSISTIIGFFYSAEKDIKQFFSEREIII